MRFKTLNAVLLAAGLGACGGGDILAIVSFIGSAGGDWNFDDPAQAGFQPRSNCGAGGNEACVINIQPIGGQDLFASDFALSFTGNLPGCPAVARTDGRANGTRITLPGCFSGNYVTINEALADNGVDRAFFDTSVATLPPGVWVEIQNGQRRFKFTSNSAGCELTTPRAPVAVTILEADLTAVPPVLQTTITNFTIGGVTWTGSFVGMSGMRLTRGNEVLELERRNLPDVC